MKYIGEGFYYRVYELDSERVSKKLQSYWFSFKKVYDFVRQRAGASFIQAVIGAHKSVMTERGALQMMKERLARVPLSLFANPVFKKGSLDYTQDKVAVMENFFAQQTLERKMKALDDYIELQKKFWSYGFHDKTYKLQPNYGIDKQGSVVCVDFGEFAFTEEQALKSIAGRKWLSRQSYKNWGDTELKSYYTEQMDRAMTKEGLASIWGAKLNH